jgi:uncharacterized ferredoxin-like protein
MSLIYEEDLRKVVLRKVAEKMLAAARTAPKARGIDNLVLAIAEEDIIHTLADKMKNMVQERNAPEFFIRDSDNILKTSFVLLLGTKISPVGLKYCGLCGFKNCEEKNNYPDKPCSFNTGDLGIAIGSAVSVAMDERIDNRVMYSVGFAAKKLNLLGEEVKIIYGIPLSISQKNPFFDRHA